MRGEFVFSQTDKRPMYQQIMDQITRRIAVGDWPPHTPLPSIREMAAEINVSVITVKRSYLELEREGVIVTQQGKGSWVNENLDVQSLQRRELKQHLESAARLATSLGLSANDLRVILQRYLP